MSFKDKTFKEKKVFYKERQKFFDAVKAAREGESPVITYKGERYKLIHPESFLDYMDEKNYGHFVMFSKAYKSNTIVEWHYGNKRGFSAWSNGTYLRHDTTRILCFAEKI